MKTLYIIDGYAQFFRAYHAIRTPMTSPVTGEPTNMTYGFVGMLLKLLRGNEKQMQAVGGKPDYITVALDVSGDRGTFRSQIFEEYKANRPPPPEDLRPQVERCLKMLDAIGLVTLGAEGYEADDVIATLAEQFKDEALCVRAITKDKDLKQLLRPVKGEDASGSFALYDIHHDKVSDAEALFEETGLKPDQVGDMLALMGDNVDNVPGVEGIGPKTAAQLIAEHGSLSALLDAADSIKGKRGERLRAARDGSQLSISRKLVELDRNTPISFDLESAQTSAIRLENLIPILKELGFNRYQDEVREMFGITVPGDTDAASAKPAQKQASSDIAFGGGLFDHIAGEPSQQSAADQALADGNYICVKTKKQLDELVTALAKAPVFAVDTETTSVQPMDCELCGLSFAIEEGKGWYVPVKSAEQDTHLDAKTVLDAVRSVLEDATKPKIGHNLKYDLLVLRNSGVELRGVAMPRRDSSELAALDTMTAAWLDDATRSSYSMDALSLAYLDYAPVSISELIGKGKKQKTFDQIPLDRASAYAAEDADITFRLAEALRPRLRAGGLAELATSVEIPMVEVLAEIEYNGVYIDADELERQRARLQTRIDELKTEIQDAAMSSCGRTFEPDSPKQLGTILFNKPTDADPGLGIKPYKKLKTGPSTDAETLDRIVADRATDSPIPKLILEYRQLTKLVSTYLVALKDAINPRTGRVHTSFHQTGAATGRLSSSDPNLQNIPIRSDIGREIRKAFAAMPGHVLVCADYSQIELRLLAHLSRDKGLIEAFERGEDIHAAVAAQVNSVSIDNVTREMRARAKAVNFGIVYGITSFGLARQLDISRTEAQTIIDDYKHRFAGITTFMQECIDEAQRYGYVTTMLGRRRAIRGLDARNPSERSLAERVAINSVVQGSAADLIKLAMVDLHRIFSPNAAHWRDGKSPEIDGVRMLIQIHDELVFEAPEPVAEKVQDVVVHAMEHAMDARFDLRVPISVDSSIAPTWFDGK
ncbi:MAG: DNA polymerase I [Phycisphaeraceae bacterium]|nr:DNA polymerase I [Phycisphaerales bacterium]MCB9861154.1 DNA polymerase I [Phycisphaeraceae bacterium]